MNERSERRNRPALSLHVPEPTPGRATRSISAISRFPPPAASAGPTSPRPPAETHELGYTLVRVLDDEGKAVGPWDPQLDPDTLRRMLRDMMMVRVFDDRMYRAQRQGKTSFYMKSTGEEAVAVAAAHALDRDDMCFPTYRQQGLLVARDYPLDRDDVPDLFEPGRPAQRAASCRSCIRDREHGFFSISGNLATQYPQAVGWAMALGDQGRQPDRRRLDRRRRDRRGRFPQRRAPSPASIARRSSSTSSTTSGRSRPSPGSPAASSPPSPRARSATALPACGSTATTRSPSMPRPAGRPTAPAPISGRP